MKKFNVFYKVHRNEDHSDDGKIKWATVLAANKEKIRKPRKYRGWYVSEIWHIAECGSV